jgi:hypothetical protein
LPLSMLGKHRNRFCPYLKWPLAATQQQQDEFYQTAFQHKLLSNAFCFQKL